VLLDGPGRGDWLAACVGRERWPGVVSGWVVADPVPVAGDELLPGVEAERSPAVEEGLEFPGWVELVGVKPGVESGDGDAGEGVVLAGSAGSDSCVAGEASPGEDALVDELGGEPLGGHVVVLLASVDISVDISVDVWTCGHLSTPAYLCV